MRNDKCSFLSTLLKLTTIFKFLSNTLHVFALYRYGRRNPLVLAVIIQACAGLGAAFSPWFTGFLVMRFLAALATGGTMITSFVLVMEIVGKNNLVYTFIATILEYIKQKKIKWFLLGFVPNTFSFLNRHFCSKATENRYRKSLNSKIISIFRPFLHFMEC